MQLQASSHGAAAPTTLVVSSPAIDGQADSAVASSTTYPYARTSTLPAAADLYGTGPAVARAWNATAVN